MHKQITATLAGTALAAACLCPPPLAAAPESGPRELARAFTKPPASARPWVYWFWLNSNITREGITADLEAMKRVGVGGVLIMEVDQGAPVGPVGFMGPQWRALFKFMVGEAHRLGLEVNMNDDAGWNGSGGPWIKPELSMQKVVWSETNVVGPRHFEGVLAPPAAVAGFYRDITVLAFPTPGAFRIDNVKAKACYEVGGPGEAASTSLPPEMVIERSRITNLSARMDAAGRLVWEAPEGNWTVLRLGHTSTGVENAPAPASGRGLECDKLSKEGIEAQFAGMMGPLIADVGGLAGKALVATHIDSWENGAQNWTARMREEFQRRRGYDLIGFLPVMTGRVVGSLETSERFLWDLRQTVSELVIENYAGHLRTLASRHGMRLTIEAYGGPCDDLPYAGRADEPMCEFWMGGGGFPTPKEMASAAHLYGKRILGAEAFTADDREKWLDHPASIKSLGDRAFCDGVNRFVFHRYALQPWADRRPGMTMGPWGLHYERTQTWWNWALGWHEYLARCQFLLRQGRFVADLCFLQPENAPQGFRGHPRQPYDYDNCPAEVVLTRMTVKEGRLTLPDGLNYRALVLPEVTSMTPALLGKLAELVQAGATVIGPRPTRSPSLTDYPNCDAEVRRLAGELWGDCDGKAVTEHRLGKGRVVWGIAPEKFLAQTGVPPDFSSGARLHYIHRLVGDTDLYFVANPEPHPVSVSGAFRVHGKRPALWWPDTGRREPVTVFAETQGSTRVWLPLGPSGSVFVVFTSEAGAKAPITSILRDGKAIVSVTAPTPEIRVRKAVYGVLSDPARTRDVRAKVQQRVDAGDYSLTVKQLALGDDPAADVVKTLVVEYAIDDRVFTVTGQDADTVHLADNATKLVVEKALYGPPGDAARTRDVTAKLQRLLDTGERSFEVARLAAGDDPAFGVVKTLTVSFTLGDQHLTATGTDPDTLSLDQPVGAEPTAEVRVGPGGQLLLETAQPGQYELQTAAGRTAVVSAPVVPAAEQVSGPWEVRFAKGWGAPERVTLPELGSWSEHSDAGVKYFSGAACYAKSVRISPALRGAHQRLLLDLGRVQVMARVKLNGRDLGLFWKPPYRVDITDAAKTGDNQLEIEVVNLWINRMLGDEQLPEDSARNPDGTLKEWPRWLQEGKRSPTGRLTFTSWRLWKKDAPLQPSGLLGPVTLRAVSQLPIKLQ